MDPENRNVILEYTPSDFFYLSAGNDMPKSFKCDEYLSNPIDCSGVITDETHLSECYKQALCNNKKLVTQLYSKQDTHSASDAKFNDINKQYSNEILKTFNLLGGIIIAIFYIHYNKP